VIAVILSSALSGTFGNAEAAARRFDAGRVTVVDSRSATLGEGLLVVRGVELAAAGWSADAIIKEMQRARWHRRVGRLLPK
jgi:fatty acid-binding protein DegV